MPSDKWSSRAISLLRSVIDCVESVRRGRKWVDPNLLRHLATGRHRRRHSSGAVAGLDEGKAATAAPPPHKLDASTPEPPRFQIGGHPSAFEDALTPAGSPDPRNDRVCITSSCPRQFLMTFCLLLTATPPATTSAP